MLRSIVGASKSSEYVPSSYQDFYEECESVLFNTEELDHYEEKLQDQEPLDGNSKSL